MLSPAAQPPSQPGARWLRLADVTRALAEGRDERAVLRTLADVACNLSGWGACVVAVADAEGLLHTWASTGLSPDADRRLRNLPMPASVFERLWGAGEPIGSMRRVRCGHPVLTAAGVASTAAAYVEHDREPDGLYLVPLRDRDGKLLGFLNPSLPPAGRPDDNDDARWSVFADLAVTALQLTAARMLDRSRGYLADALLQGVARVRSSLQLEQVLTDIAESMTAAGGFNRVAISLLDEDGQLLRTVASAGLPEADANRLRDNPTRWDDMHPLMRPEMRVSRSYLYDHRYFDLPPELLAMLSVPDRDDDADDVAGRWHRLDSLTVPLIDERREVLGTISADEPWDGQLPDLAHIQALEYFADQAAVAIQQARQHQRLTAQARTDALTGVGNRAVLLEALPRALAEAAMRGTRVAVLFCDIDHFKDVNDTYGHAVGDEVLRCVADEVTQALRSGDLLTRYGGEEFVALAPDTGRGQAAAIAERIRGRVAAMRRPTLPPELSARVSIGVALSGSPGPRPADVEVDWAHEADLLLTAADRLLYEAKVGGRNQVRLTA